MRSNRFFVEENFESLDEISLTDQEIVHQISHVLRLKEGEPIILFNNTGQEFHGRVKEILKKNLRISKEKIKFYPQNFLRNISLYACLLKSDKFDWVIQKSTELGVSQIIPVVSERTEKTGFNLIRAKKIAKEASEQSGRVFLPEIFEPKKLEDALNLAQENSETILCLDMNGKSFSELKDLPNKISIFIGSEGGWSERELNLFEDSKVEKISINKNTLRAETASVAAMTLLSVSE